MNNKIENKTLPRRSILKCLALGVTAISPFGQLLYSNEAVAQQSKRVLVLYFSKTGNTEELAKQVHNIVGGDILQLKTINAYPIGYDETTAQARRELDSGYKPPIETKIDNLASYDIIFLGYPCWWGTLPMAFVTLFEQHDFSGKIIAPFTTHEGSYLGSSVSDIKKLAPSSTVQNGVAVRGRSAAKNSQKDITRWLNDIGLAKVL